MIYTNRLAGAALVLLVIYAKSARDNMPAHVLRRIVQELDDET